MRLLTRGLIVAALAGTSAVHSEDSPDFATYGKPFVTMYCIECHRGADAKAELAFDAVNDTEAVIRGRGAWESAIRMVIAGEMPPEDHPQPTVKEAEAFVEHVKAIFDFSDRHAKPDPGRVTMRRLNKVEYRNTVQDLIGVAFDPTEDFPSDDIGHGFDNIGDVLTVSPVLMERYMAAAETIMDQAISTHPPEVIKRHLSSTYTEPASADVATKMMVDGFRRLTSNATEAIEVGPLHTPYQWEDGDYLFRTRAYAHNTGATPVKVAILIHGADLADPSSDEQLATIAGNVLKPAKILKIHELKANHRDQAETIEVQVPMMKGRHRMMVGQLKPTESEAPTQLFVEYMALDGPLDTRPKSQQKLLACDGTKPQPEQTKEVMSRFLRRAFRRRVTEEELQRSIDLVDASIVGGESWVSSVQLAMQAALCSPKFLFRVEQDEAPSGSDIQALDEFQLACRLSYFLWSSMPDDQLLNLAESGQLAGNLDAQVTRMLTDARSSSLVQNFALQWLQIKRIASVAPDVKLFPSFNDDLRQSMLKETELFVQSILREDRSVMDLITADFTYLNETLARHYGVTDTNGSMAGRPVNEPPGQPIRGPEFVRVTFSDSSRGGLLTQGSILTVTSNPTRTSPVKRGRWVLEQILGSPPPGPPPNVPELPASEAVVASTTVRQRLEEHRKNPACANCHAKMDPIGFALENFDAVGAYREKDGAFDIDASGEFSDGTKFSGVNDLKSIITARRAEVARCLCEKLMTYALGRGIEYYDRPVIEKILKSIETEDYRFSVLVTQIVKSEAFRQRRGASQ